MLRAALLAVLLASQAQAGCETILATDFTKVAKTGDTMTGPLVFSGASSYVTAVSSINAQGVWGTFTGNLTGNVTGNCSGNAGTATALAANGANCSAGEAPLGVSAAGAAEGCYDVATQTELDAHTSATSAHSATDANTASRIVLRDASGNFSAGTITANLTGAVTGNATTASALAANGANCSAGQYPLGVNASGAAESCTPAGVGDVTSTASNSFNTAATEQTFGSSVTVKGRLAVGSSIDVNGTWATWTPSFTGFSVNPTIGLAKYTKIGKLVIANYFSSGNGTSNATSYTMTLPVAARTADISAGWGAGVDNSAGLSNPCRIDTAAGVTTANFYRDFQATAWTASGAKNCNFTIVYEAAE